MLLLQRGQLTEQLVELAVRDDGSVSDVIAELVAADFLSQFLPPPAHVCGLGIYLCLG